MATVDVSVSSDLSPSDAWKLASNLRRFDEWLTIFGGWRGEVPDVIGQGTEVSSLIRVKGFRNVIHWTVTRYDEPQLIALSGSGRGGARISLTMVVEDAPDAGSTFHLRAVLSGSLLGGPIGLLVAKLIDSDVRKSVANLAALR